MKSAVFSVRIQFDDDNDPINPVHLCEEIQAYLNSWHCAYDETGDQYQDAKVVGYKLQFDTFKPFIAEEEY